LETHLIEGIIQIKTLKVLSQIHPHFTIFINTTAAFMNGRILYILTYLSALLFSCGNDKKENTQQNKPNKPQGVAGYIVRYGNIGEELSLPATILPNETTEIHSETSGIIRSLYINDGEIVQESTLLAKLNDDEFQAQLKKLKVQLEIAIKTEERNKALLNINGISQQDYDISFLQVNNIRADIELTNALIRKTEVRAPFTGKIGFRNISPGAYVTPATTLTTIRQINALKLEFNMPDKYAAGVKVGAPFNFNIQGSSNLFSSKVYAIESYVNEQSRGMKVRCYVTSKDPSLLAGAFATIKINTGNNSQSLIIPSQSIIPQARGKKVILYRSGIARMTEVQTGLRDSSRVEIISGLEEGDTILTTGLMSVKQDNPVQLTKVD
jgi:membrane fusion protein (multidrug efflux system)